MFDYQQRHAPDYQKNFDDIKWDKDGASETPRALRKEGKEDIKALKKGKR